MSAAEKSLAQLRAEAVEIKPFVPAKDAELSIKFYEDIGFEMRSRGGGVAYMAFGGISFLLQEFYQKELAENLMIHLLVKDAVAYHKFLVDKGIAAKYGVKITDPETQPWNMVDFCLADPSGVLWRIGHNI